MVCPRCSSLTPEAGSLGEMEGGGPAAGTGAEGAQAGVLCPDCGRLLPPAGMAERLFTKLSELARFGLVDHAAPILKASGSSEEDPT